MATQQIASIIDQLNMQTRLFKNVVADIKEEDAKKQFTPDTNHTAWLAGHTVSTRYDIGKMFGVQASEPYPELFAQGKGIQAGATYPSISDLTKDWDSISDKVITKLNTLTDSELSAPLPFKLPIADTIGQLGLLRRLNGYPAMTYA
jgi:hypothetical protein